MSKQYIVSLNPECPNCKSSKNVVQDYKGGHWVCSNCGIVVGDPIISEGSEWRSFEDHGGKDDPSRVGGRLDNEGNLSTSIHGGDFNDSSFLSTQNRRIDTKDRTLNSGFSLIFRVGGKLSLPHDIINTAQEVFKQVYEHQGLLSRRKDVVVTASLFLACRQHKSPHTLRELCEQSDVRKKEVGRSLTKDPILSKKFKNLQKFTETSNSVVADALISRICSDLKLPYPIISQSKKIISEIQDKNLAEGKQHTTVAAASIMIALHHYPSINRTFTQIARASQMAEGTIKAAVKQLQPHISDYSK